MARYLEPDEQTDAISDMSGELFDEVVKLVQQYPILVDPRARRGEIIRRYRAAIELLPAFK